MTIDDDDDVLSPGNDDDILMINDHDEIKLEPTSLENSPRISSSLHGKLHQNSNRNTPNNSRSRGDTPTQRKLATPPFSSSSRNDTPTNNVRSNGTPTPRPSTTGKFSDRMRSSLALDTTNNTVIRPAVNDGNIVIVSELKGEISKLKKEVAKKDFELLEKDKQASMLKVEHIREVRALQAKFKTQEEDYLKSIEGLRKKNQELLRKVAQISKGKL